MTRFEFTDPDGDRLVAEPARRDDDTPAVALMVLNGTAGGATLHVPLVRLEEVVAGLRDMARQAGGQTAPTCGHPCPKPGHSHTCQRSPQHLDVHRDVKQKGDEACRWDTPRTPSVDEVLDIVRRWYVDVNDGAGWDADDLVHDLEQAGYPLPADEAEE